MDLTGDLLLVWVVENTIVCSALATLVFTICRWWKPRAAICHALWLCVVIKLVIPPFLLWSWFVPEAATAAPTATPTSEIDLQALAEESNGVRELAAVGASSPAIASLPEGQAPRLSALSGVAVGGWLVGAGFLVFRWSRRVTRFRALVRDAVPAPIWIRRETRDLCRSLRLRPPQLRVVPGLGAPCAGGVGRPSVFWSPRLLRRRDRHRVRAVLAHELAHLKRWDHLTATFEVVATLFWWWHPLLWLARHQMHEYSEQACDNWALELGPISPREYANTLIDFSAAPAALTAVAMGGTSRAALRRRLVRVMSGNYEWRLPGRAVAAMGIGMTLLLPSWMCREAPWARAASLSADWFGHQTLPDPESPPHAPCRGGHSPDCEHAPSPEPDAPAPVHQSATMPVVEAPEIVEETAAKTTESPADVIDARVEARRVLGAMIKLRARQASAEAIARDLVAAVEDMGAASTNPIAILESLSHGRDRTVARIARRALRELGDRN